MKGAKVGFIGCGVMGEALIRAICKQITPSQVYLFDTDAAKSSLLIKELGCTQVKNAGDIALKATHIFLAVKPAVVPLVLKEIAPLFGPSSALPHTPVIISIAAGVNLASLTANLLIPGNPDKKIQCIRLMPNLPAIVGESMIALCANPDVEIGEIETVKMLLSKAGRVEQVSETLMDGVTAVSGSGPAYGFMFIEALADAAVSFGLPRKQAYIYAAQTLKGAAETVLATGRHPAELKDSVCSPAGTTIEAVKTLEAEGFRSAIIKAAKAAFEKSIELGTK
jgi:pyrroline-5-carboxylate reductase